MDLCRHISQSLPVKVSIVTRCYHCAAGERRLYSLPVAEDNFYEFACENGHKFHYTSTDHRFQVLLAVALNALVDGYQREAVASATAALERFYELVTRTLLREQKQPKDIIDKTWRDHFRNSSERQLGVFIGTFLSIIGKVPPTMPSDGNHSATVAFRNSVIHKGVFPTNQEAQSYVQGVVDLIVPVLIEVKWKAYHLLQEVSMEDGEEKARPKLPTFGEGGGFGGSISLCPVSLLALPNEKHISSVDEMLDEIRRLRRYHAQDLE
jgi:hypothetical protein